MGVRLLGHGVVHSCDIHTVLIQTLGSANDVKIRKSHQNVTISPLVIVLSGTNSWVVKTTDIGSRRHQRCKGLA